LKLVVCIRYNLCVVIVLKSEVDQDLWPGSLFVFLTIIKSKEGGNG